MSPPALPVIDACALVHDPPSWGAYLARLARDAPEYLSVFARSFRACLGVDELVWDAVRDGPDRRAALARLVERLPPFVLDRYLEERARDHVVCEIAMGSPECWEGTRVNDRVARLAERSDGRLRAWAGVSLRDLREALAELRRCADLGMRGFNVIPFLDGVDVAAPECAPVFDFAASRGMAVWVHTGHHFARTVPLDVCGWRHIDRLAARHPGLTVVVGHAGWPWIREMVGVALRHENVLLEVSSHRPRSMAVPGSGWEPLLFHGARALRGSVMFGTSTWVNPVPVQVLARELLGLGLPPDVTELWLRGNAEQLLARLGGAPVVSRRAST